MSNGLLDSFYLKRSIKWIITRDKNEEEEKEEGKMTDYRGWKYLSADLQELTTWSHHCGKEQNSLRYNLYWKAVGTYVKI